MNFHMNNKGQVLIVGLVALVVGLLIGSWRSGEESHKGHADNSVEQAQAEVWTCSMHPQIRMPEPGPCPICGMDLIPVRERDGDDELGPRQLRLSERAQKLASIQVAPVQRVFAEAETRLMGKVAVDETRKRHIAAWIPGRIDRLYVDYTGIPVAAGDHMAYLYSPELLTAQEELIQALRTVEQTVGMARSSAEKTATAARERLRLWGLKAEQINGIEREQVASDHLTIHAPAGGVVVEKHVSEGTYVQTGTRIYTIADLSQVWLLLEAYERDLVWLRYGQEVRFETEAYPGERFAGRIAFISPVLDERTRTVEVRVNAMNADGRLKPGMFARGVVRARVAASGKVMEPDLAGKWISPMHPEIVKDGPGACDVCGMPLVRAEELGYASSEDIEGAPLVVPASAVMVTGKRSVVYVAVAGKEGVFEGREVELGPRVGDYYILRKGLDEGEQVVVNGSFKIDSALQILARPSMMNPEGGGRVAGHGDHGAVPTGSGNGDARSGRGEGDGGHEGHEMAGESGGALDVPTAFRTQLSEVFDAYFEIQQGLSLDDFERSARGAEGVAAALEGTDMGLLRGEAHAVWMEVLKGLRAGSEGVRGAADVEAARAVFDPLSTALAQVAREFGTGREGEVFRFHCPMAFGNQGASWLQEGERTENPYFGSRMYRCGSQKEAFPTAAAAATAAAGE